MLMACQFITGRVVLGYQVAYLLHDGKINKMAEFTAGQPSKEKILSQPQYSLSYRFLISSLSSIVCKNQYWLKLHYVILHYFFYLACNFLQFVIIKIHFTMVLKTLAVGGS